MDSPDAKAFSLIELLVTIAIMAILLAVAVPAVSSLARSSDMSRAGQMLMDALIQARQESLNRNCKTEIRLVKSADSSSPGYQAFQVWQVGETSSMPIDRLTRLPESIIVSSDPRLSPLLTADTMVSGTASFGGVGSRAYRGFRFRPGGGLSSAITLSNNFLTLVSIKDLEAIPPANFYAVRLQPLSGRPSVIRP